jgi:hypothetical protein
MGLRPRLDDFLARADIASVLGPDFVDAKIDIDRFGYRRRGAVAGAVARANRGGDRRDSGGGGDMGGDVEHTGGQRVRFVFSYGEHEPWLPPDAPPEGEAVNQAFVRHLRQREWEPVGPAGDDFSSYCHPDIRSVADLAAVVRENYMGDPDQPDEVVELPFVKLAALMDRGGWSFVGGDFLEFEGNHNDTELTVVLERKAPGS